ncbi:MAG: DUF2950 domain-containing protein [Acidobacteriota bacterium]|nr:DUF2950 domain-containing protein [Acidobacteriota bacterium]
MRLQSKFIGGIAAVAVLVLCTVLAGAQDAGQTTFVNPQDAGKAFYTAVKAGDKAAMTAILGPSGSGIISSGDEVQDKKNAAFFVEHYEQMNRWAKEINGDELLIIGAENWPFPIPLKNAGGKWYFDTKAGVEEILYRRIGKNEMAAIRVSEALADAQNEYFGQKQEYAQKIISDAGQQNGLYWKVAEGGTESPIGPLVAYATREGYGNKAQPFHGYFFRVLTAQGANAKGGAKNYVVDGKMTGGFAFVAWPAEYRNSGVMTFLIDQNGVVREKHLGPKTADIVKAMTTYNPDKTWRTVAEPDEEVEE